MKTTFLLFRIQNHIHYFNCTGIRALVLLVMIVSADCCFAQSIVRLNQVGTNDWNFHNSISDEQGHIYYCTREVVNINSLNVTCMSKDLAIRLSYNYDNPGIEPISGMSYKDGKLYITTGLRAMC